VGGRFFLDSTGFRTAHPKGWYLPSDADWSALEREIYTNYTQYSTATNVGSWGAGEAISWRNNGTHGHGEAMRNHMNFDANYTQSPPGASNSKESGFSGLLIGYASSGSWNDYGSYADYWSSSSNSSTDAWRRNLRYSNAGVGRNAYNKYHLWSVRCKRLN
jgi:uncharacterized protein (TIGR02145 family)